MNDLNILDISELIRVTQVGGSYPYYVKADSKQYVLKCRVSALDSSGTHLWVEAFSYLYLQKIGYKKIPNICILHIDNHIVQQAKNRLKKYKNKTRTAQREIDGLQQIIKSQGLNLGIEYIHDSEKLIYNSEKHNELAKTCVQYDWILTNSDRDKDNPNILQTRTKEYLIDFGLAFYGHFDQTHQKHDNLFPDDIPSQESINKNYFDNRYLFLDNLKEIKKPKTILQQKEILEIIQQIPREWIGDDKYNPEYLANFTYARQKNINTK